MRPSLVELADAFYKVHGQSDDTVTRYEYAQYALALGLLDTALCCLFFYDGGEMAQTILSQDIPNGKAWANTNYTVTNANNWPKLRLQCYDMGNDPHWVMWKAFYHGEVKK